MDYLAKERGGQAVFRALIALRSWAISVRMLVMIWTRRAARWKRMEFESAGWSRSKSSGVARRRDISWEKTMRVEQLAQHAMSPCLGDLVLASTAVKSVPVALQIGQVGFMRWSGSRWRLFSMRRRR